MHLSRKPLGSAAPVMRAAANTEGLLRRFTASAAAMGEFRALARLATTPRERAEPESGDGLSAALAAIAEEEHLFSAIVGGLIAKDFAGRMAAARKHLPKGQVAGAVRALKQARAAALAALRREVVGRIRGRQAALRRARRGRLRVIRSGDGPGR